MTTANEHHDAQLAAIKANHEQVRALFADPQVSAIGLRDMRIDQTGLAPVYVDSLGRFWTIEAAPSRMTARMVFDPHGPTRGREDFDLQTMWA